MSAITFRDRVESILCFLWGSPYKSPLNRKEFIKAALFVFIVRGAIAWCLTTLLFHLAQYITFQNIQS